MTPAEKKGGWGEGGWREGGRRGGGVDPPVGVSGCCPLDPSPVYALSLSVVGNATNGFEMEIVNVGEYTYRPTDGVAHPACR